MNRAERIRLIEETGAALSTLPSPKFQLILRTHLVETFDYEDSYLDGDVLAYCMDRAESIADDTMLRELHTYSMGQAGDDATAQALISKPWGDNPVAVFISHRHEDAPFASVVRQWLMTRWGCDAFVAHTSLDGGRKWRDGIREALSTCHFFVAIMHPEFHSSEWCDQEVGWALGRRLPVLPFRFMPYNDFRRDGFLGEHQEVGIDVTRQEPEWFVAQTIFEKVLAEPRSHHLGIDALAEAFVNSRRFNQTDILWPLVKKYEQELEPQHLARLEHAVKVNDQISRCFSDGEHVADGVAALLERRRPAAPATRKPGNDPWAAKADEPPF